MTNRPMDELPNVPEFPDDLDWINTSGAIKIGNLRGKLVLLDFWTYG